MAMDMDDISGLQTGESQGEINKLKKGVAFLCELLKPVNLYFECICGCSQAAVCFCSDEKLL